MIDNIYRRKHVTKQMTKASGIHFESSFALPNILVITRRYLERCIYQDLFQVMVFWPISQI